MDYPDHPISQTSDRRRHRRRATEARVRLSVETAQFSGEVENLSRSGVLFFADGNLRVSIEIEEEGKATKRTGRIVRAQRIRGDTFGWAIEFDP